jgi:hypothetical protein
MVVKGVNVNDLSACSSSMWRETYEKKKSKEKSLLTSKLEKLAERRDRLKRPILPVGDEAGHEPLRITVSAEYTSGQKLETSDNVKRPMSAGCVVEKMSETKDQVKRPMGSVGCGRFRPGQPLSAYNFFHKEEHQKSSKRNDKVKFQGLNERMGSKWKSLSKEEMSAFREKANKDKKRRAKEMKAYEEWIESVEEKEEEETSEKKRSKGYTHVQANVPKCPLSAYNFFFKEERDLFMKKHGKVCFKELTKTMGTKWKNLSKEETAYYKKKAERDLVRYAREMKAYEKWQNSMDAFSSLKERGTTHFEQNQMEAPKPRRPLTAYNLFFKDERKKMQKENGNMRIDFNILTKTMNMRWKALSAESVLRYKAIAERDLARYKKDVEAFGDRRE